MLAKTPKPPYYAVIFSNTKREELEGYQETADRMWELAHQQPGFLGVEHAASDIAITVSYWESLEAIAQWKANTEHRVAQKHGREDWYASFQLRIAKVERAYDFEHKV